MARNKYPEETKKLIVDTAARLFMEKGYDHTSIQDIIDNLGGLTKGAIYHHFKSKEDIVYAVFEKMYAQVDIDTKKVCESKNMNGFQKLQEVFRLSIFNPAQNDVLVVAIDMIKNPQLPVIYLRDMVQTESTEMVRRILEEGIEDGSIKTEYPKELAEVLMLLGGIWINPMVYPCDSSEIVKKVRFYQHMLEALGLNIIEDSWIDQIESYAALYQENQK
ncbi:MAG: TetR/AcrR family transcriptional regulator [[Clostridium] scindens]|uniref:TetR/AcrR family transcriptional regulator n=1 Tax=Clostridium scindens (strain JCM 10418 / VPI 12708) TaxID=29347 RepID=UPI00399A04C4